MPGARALEVWLWEPRKLSLTSWFKFFVGKKVWKSSEKCKNILMKCVLYCAMKTHHGWCPTAVLPPTASVSCVSYLLVLSLNVSLYETNNQVRDHEGSLLAFRSLESIPRVRTHWRPLFSSHEDTSREAQTPSAKTWMQPQDLSQYRVPDTLPTSQSLPVQGDQFATPVLNSIVLLSQDELHQKSQALLRASHKVFAEKTLQDQLLPCC